jgi:hypothetical protein
VNSSVKLGWSKIKLVAALIIAFIFSAVFCHLVFAGSYSGNIYGRPSYRGYFDYNDYDTSSTSTNAGGVLDTISGVVHGYNSSGQVYTICSNGGGLAIPSCVNNISAFVDFLRYLYFKGNSQAQTGAAFVVETILNVQGPSSNRTIPNDDWSNLSLGLSRVSINWGGQVTIYKGTVNSYKQKNYNDDAFYTNNKTETGDAIIISNGNNTYRLFRRCANPVGPISWSDLPVEWAVKGYSSVESLGNNYPTGYSTNINAYPGDTLHFSHHLDVTDGIAAITNWTIRRNDNAVLQNYNGGSTITGTGTIVSANDSGGTGGGNSNYMTYPVTQSNVGSSQLCQRIEWIPTSYSDLNASGSTYACANFPYSFRLIAETDIYTSNQSPNQNIIFKHKLSNSGPTKVNGAIVYTTGIARSSYDISAQTTNMGGSVQSESYLNIPASDSTGNSSSSVVLEGWFNSTKYTIVQADVNNWVCGYIEASPYSSGDSSAIYSYKCKFIPYNYALVPHIGTNMSNDVVEANAPINVEPSVVNSGPTKSQNTQWQITQMAFNSGVTVPSSNGFTSSGNNNVCQAYFNVNGATNCSVLNVNGVLAKSNNGSVFNASSPATTPTTVLSGDGLLSGYPTIVGDYPAGTKICYAFSVQPHSSSVPPTGGDSQWIHSVPTCLVIGKRPKVQFWGGNLLVGGLINTSTSSKTLNGVVDTFGSWDEYGVFTVGANNGMASGSAFNGGLAVTTVCDYSTLSFTNVPLSGKVCTGDKGTIGNYTLSDNLPNIASAFLAPGVDHDIKDKDSSAAVLNILFPAPGLYIETRSVAGDDDLTLNVSQLDPGKSVILEVSGTVTIAGNQTYDPNNKGAKYHSTTELPQLIIIANKIIIKDTVTNVDAWLIATGKDGILDTCSIDPSDVVSSFKLTTNMCDSSLTVNGPVIAQHLWLRRTAGSGTDAAHSSDGKDHSGDPAEVFNLRSDAYLWAMAQATSSGRIQTVFTTELPPRL